MSILDPSHSQEKSNSSRLKQLRKIANTSIQEDSVQKTHNSYESSKPQLQNLQKYQKIFNDSNLVSSDMKTYVPKSILNKSLATSFKTSKRVALDSLSRQNKNDLTDIDVQKKSQMTQSLLGDEISKKREKIKSTNDISFLQTSKDLNRTINKEGSIIRDGPEALAPFQRKTTNFYEKMYTFDHGNTYEVSMGTLKEKLSPDILSQKLPSRAFNLSNLGYDEIPSSSLNSLNKTLKSSSQTQIHFHTSQNKLLKNPNSRKDIEELDSWLKYMIAQQDITLSGADGVKKILENTHVIYNACLKEVIRQISMDCSERGQFLQKIWDSYLGLLERALIENKKESSVKDQENIEETARIHKMYQREIESLGELIRTLQFDKEKLETSNHSSRDRIKDLKRRLKELNASATELMKENEVIRRENEIILKENLDLNVRVDDLVNGGNQNLEKSRTYSPAQFQRSALNRRGHPLYGSPKGNKEKLGLFAEEGSSVVGHLMFFKAGEVIEPAIKLAELQKIKERFPEDTPKIEPESPFSPRRLRKIQNTEPKVDIEKPIEDAPKEPHNESHSSLNSVDHKEDKNEGTDPLCFEDKGVNTEDVEEEEVIRIQTPMSVKLDGNKDFEDFLSNLLEEVKHLSEDDKEKLKLKILQEVKGKLNHSLNIMRKVSLIEQEADDMRRKYRDLLIQCNEMEIEKNVLNEQLMTANKKAKTFELWNNEEDLEDKTTQEGEKKDDLPFKERRKTMLESFLDQFLEIEDGAQTERSTIIIDTINEDNLMNKPIKETEENKEFSESSESDTSIISKKIRMKSETDLNIKIEKIESPRRNSEKLKDHSKIKKLSWNKGKKPKKIDQPKKNIQLNMSDRKEPSIRPSAIKEKGDGKAKERKAKAVVINEKPERNSTKTKESTFEKSQRKGKIEDGTQNNERNERKNSDLDKLVLVQEKSGKEKIPTQLEIPVVDAIHKRSQRNESLFTRVQKKAATLTKMLRPMFRNYKGYYSVNSDDANSVLQVVNSLQISEIRPLSLMTVLKFICTIYQERRKTGSNSQAPLHIFCYDFFISQYGLKKLAEDKLRKIFSTCLFYHEKNNRINVFCRLVGIKYMADPYDATYYLSSMKFFEDNPRESVGIASNFNPAVFVSFSEVSTFLEDNYKNKLHKDTYQKLDAILSEKKQVDPVSQRIIIDFDFFMIHILKTFSDQKDEMRKHLHDLFYSADLDQDEFIEYYEFLMLNRHIEKDMKALREAKKIFIEESDCIVPSNSEKALSFNKFIDISIDYGLFSEHKTNEFLKTDDLANFEELIKNFKEKLELLKMRFIKSKHYDARYKAILDNLDKKIKKGNLEEREKKILWISYRLVDEESKRLVIEQEMESLLPSEIRDLVQIYHDNQFEEIS